MAGVSAQADGLLPEGGAVNGVKVLRTMAHYRGYDHLLGRYARVVSWAAGEREVGPWLLVVTVRRDLRRCNRPVIELSNGTLAYFSELDLLPEPMMEVA